VINQTSSKWYLYDQYPHATLPDYAAGPGYFLGSALVDRLYEQRCLTRVEKLMYVYVLKNGQTIFCCHRNELIIYRAEDAGVGIWLSNINFTEVEIPALLYSRTCDDTSQEVFVNPLSSQEV
jgi:hypothetical protein